MGAGMHGGFGNTKGKNKHFQSAGKGSNVSLPKGKSQLKHIFDDRPGHLTDTPYHRKLLKDLSNTQQYFKGTDKRGDSWNIKIMKDGSQLWVKYRNGIVQNGGKNIKPRKWDKETGLNNNPFKKKKGTEE